MNMDLKTYNGIKFVTIEGEYSFISLKEVLKRGDRVWIGL